MKQQLYYIHCISALHVGIGQGTGIIDLPIAREKASNLPQVPGSAIKGVLRDELRETMQKEDCLALFGPETGETASEYAGALAVGDARLLCLPIRSWYGTFAWATCPMILRRYQRDLQSSTLSSVPDKIPVPAENEALHYLDLAIGTKIKDNNDKIYLEDLDLIASEDNHTDQWADIIAAALFKEQEWQALFKQRFVVLPDNVFDFLAETATEIRARIRIEEATRTVQSGALWYEEYLPAETLLWGNIATDRSRKDKHPKTAEQMLELLPNTRRLQVGGNATVGAGQVRWTLPAKE
jgi:CRISPR-associated protein Cmr4